ncbi:MAG: hypothetical protein H6844_15705 [Alphaproteobacteria bacterium]|nr:hypothetical protein [Alphaproteobacteria bacterium]
MLGLAGRIDPSLRQTPYWDARARVALLRYDLAGACALPAEAGDAAATADWQRLAAFCRLLRSQEEAAMVGVMLADELADKQDGDDAVFAHLFLARQFPDRPTGPSVMPSKPLHLAMFRALSQPMALPRTWADMPADVASGIARYPAAGLEPRTAAAERAVAANLLPADLLVQLYLASELTTPLGTAYRQMAYIQGGAGAEVAAESFWDAAQTAGVYAQLAPFSLAFAPARPDAPTSHPAYAARALRAALIADDPAAIGDWQDAFRTASLTVAGAKTLHSAYAVLALAGEPVPPPEVWWPAWQQAVKPGKDEIALVAGLLQALGQPVPKARGPKADRSKTARAIAEAPLGEAALLALNALAGTERPSHGLQVQAVGTLARLSPADARAIALELAVGSGL